jgi:glycosyltransferase involved in cell wall biosynthesis
MRFSVIITTFNRVDTLPRAVDSVLSQEGVDLELIVVDDGSTDATRSYLTTMIDARVTVLRRDNGGLSAARNTGITHASGDWTAFLDDDDMALPGWLAAFAQLIDERTGFVCCGAEYCTADGTRLGLSLPRPMGVMFGHQTALFLAGTFACRTDLLKVVGGYDERLTCSHQTELAMRLMPPMLERGLQMRSTDQVKLRIERRDANERPMSNPAALYHGTRVLLEKHSDRFALHALDRARSYGVLGVSAARLGHWSEARSALLVSARAEPLNARRWIRLAAACCPPLARRAWRAADYEPQVPA